MALQMSLILIILCEITLINFTFTEANPTYLDSKCSNNMIFPPNSEYQSNLNSLFLSLISMAATANSGTTVNNDVYGLFLCRGDLSTTSCKVCVVSATFDLSQSYCPFNKAAMIWYNECTFRYSNESFFGRMEDSPKVIIWNSQNITGNKTHFTNMLTNSMNDLVVHATNNNISENTFYANVVKITGFQTLRAVSQCTPDLTASDCTRCLKIAISHLPVSITGRVLQPSCNIWYDVYKTNISSIAPSNSEIKYSSGKKQLSIEVVLATLVPVASVSMAVLVLCMIIKRAKKSKNVVRNDGGEVDDDGINIESLQDDDGINIESLQYDLLTLQRATNNFSEGNKLGRGPFGTVYKGILLDGAKIVVRRVSMFDDYYWKKGFINEVMSLAKLKHKNLVRLLGFCVKGEEAFVVYEYMPYDLNHVILAPQGNNRLNWGSRFQIIKGVARGLLYLHQDSRLRIIHRDLNSHNVLLDYHLNPKIADFSIAMVLHDDQAKEVRFAGTYGYICPEYMTNGRLSVQSDVYSFGILILEIISGTTYRDYYLSGKLPQKSFRSHAREEWREGRVLEFVDEAIRDSGPINEIERCVHLGLLCAEDNPDHRPTMATVVPMLESHSVTLPRPERPAYMSHEELNISNRGEPDQSINMPMAWSVNEVSITELEPR